MIKPKDDAVDLLYQCLQVSAQVDLNTSPSCIPNHSNSLRSEHYYGVLDLKQLLGERGLNSSRHDRAIVCLQIQVPFLFECEMD